MYLLFVSLVLSLALGPDVKLLSAHAADDQLRSAASNAPMVFTNVIKSSPGQESTAGGMNIRITDATTRGHATTPENANITSEETSEHTTVVPSPEPAAATVLTIITTDHLSTSASPPESTPLRWKETFMTNVVTTEAHKTPVFTNVPSSNEEESIDTSPTTTPTTSPTTPPTTSPTTPPNIKPTTMPTTTPRTTPMTTINTTTIITNAILTTQKQTTPSPPAKKSSTPTNSPNIIGAGSSKDSDDSKPKWLMIAIIALVLFCIITTICVIGIIFKRRKQSGKQRYGYTNGQKRSKKKGPEDDVWAGPVKLGGGDCEAPEEGDALGEDKNDGVEVTGLSTFSTLEENGGVGRPGSPEVKKWEEKDPLLFIDEEGKEAGKSEDTNAKEEAGKSDTKEAELNGGETFCLTTAV